MTKDNPDRFADPIHCSPADGRLVPIDPGRSPAECLTAINEVLIPLIGQLDASAKEENDDAWKAFYAAEDARCAAARIRSAIRQLNYSQASG